MVFKRLGQYILRSNQTVTILKGNDAAVNPIMPFISIGLRTLSALETIMDLKIYIMTACILFLGYQSYANSAYGPFEEFRDSILVENNPFANISMTPTRGESQIVGKASRACIFGARPLIADSTSNFFVSNVKTRNFNWAHRETIDHVKNLAEQSRGICKLVFRDLSQARGGPALHRHGTHQAGVDSDIEYSCLDDNDVPSLEQRIDSAVTLDMPVLDKNGTYHHFTRVFDTVEKLEQGKRDYFALTGRTLTDDLAIRKERPALWDDKIIQVLKTAATAEKTERIIVNPVVKFHICDQLLAEATRHKGSDLTEDEIEEVLANNPWLIKLRFNPGHSAHFHLRVSCPEDSPLCVDSEVKPYPESVAGTGCIGAQRDFYYKDKSISVAEMPTEAEARDQWLQERNSWLAGRIRRELYQVYGNQRITGPNKEPFKEKTKRELLAWLNSKIKSLPNKCEKILKAE